MSPLEIAMLTRAQKMQQQQSALAAGLNSIPGPPKAGVQGHMDPVTQQMVDALVQQGMPTTTAPSGGGK